MTYRTDINGLRGLAIALVVGFHAFPNVVLNGYLGVDIFFVVSGYLITSIVFLEITSGQFTFPNFFARRIKRLLPAATAVLLATTIFANLTLFDKEWFAYLANLKAVFGFHLNYQLISESGYFDTASNLKPLLHFWSLNLEEQFYLIWPFCLVLLLERFKTKPSFIFKLNFLLIAISLTQFMSFDSENYYSLTARAWQLLVGAQIAIGTQIMKNSNLQGALKNCSGWLVAGGLLSLVASQIIELRQMATLFAILGTSLLIIAKDSPLKIIYDNLILGLLGLISYSLYLWHWPMLSFLKIFYGSDLSIVTLWLAILASLFFSIFTYVAIEKPLAKQKWSFNSLKVTKPYNAPSTFAVTYGVFFFLALHIPRLGSFDLSGSNADLLPNVSVGTDSCFIENPISAWCQSDQPKTDHTIRGLLLGDCHSWSQYSGLREVFPNVRWSMISNSGCSPFVVENLSDKSCQQDFKKAIAMFEKQSDYKILVITSANRIFFNNKEKITQDKNLQYLKTTMAKLARLGKTVIFFGPRPEISENVMGCIKKRPDFIQRYIDNSTFCEIDKNDWERQSLEYKNFLKDLANSTHNNFIDPESLICKTSKCSIVNNGKTMYIDKEYLSNYGSLKMAELAREILDAYEPQAY